MLAFHANGTLDRSSGHCRDFGHPVSITRPLPLTPQHARQLPPSLTSSLSLFLTLSHSPSPSALVGPESKFSLNQHNALGGRCSLFFLLLFSFLFLLASRSPLGEHVGLRRWAHGGRCHREESHPRRRQNQANCCLNGGRKRLGPQD